MRLGMFFHFFKPLFFCVKKQTAKKMTVGVLENHSIIDSVDFDHTVYYITTAPQPSSGVRKYKTSNFYFIYQ